MSFEDDEYWDDEYSAKSRPVSYADNTAVARDRYADELDLEPPPPRRRAGRPVDELAVRRRRRNTGPSGTPRGEFDSERPAWLDDPDFVPTDITQPDPEAAVLDFNRPELGSNFDNPEFPSGRRLPAARDDWDDEIDEPFDHRAGLDRRSALPSLAPPSGPYDEDEWDQPAPPRRPFAPRPSSGRPYAAPRPVPSREPELPATGRAQVPYDDEYGPGLRDDDALELYRPRRSSRDDDRRRDPSRDRPAARRTEPSPVEPGGYDDDDLRWDRDRPVSPAAEAPDSPRVISRPVPSPAPRVISRAAQPPAPRVVNKAQPTLPAVVSGPPQSAPARPLPPTSPTSPAAPAAPARPAPTRPAPTRPAPASPAPAAASVAPLPPGYTPSARPGSDVSRGAAVPPGDHGLLPEARPMSPAPRPMSPEARPMSPEARPMSPAPRAMPSAPSSLPPPAGTPAPRGVPAAPSVRAMSAAAPGRPAVRPGDMARPDASGPTTGDISLNPSAAGRPTTGGPVPPAGLPAAPPSTLYQQMPPPGRGPRVAAVGPAGPDSAESWQINALPPAMRRTSSMPPNTRAAGPERPMSPAAPHPHPNPVEGWPTAEQPISPAPAVPPRRPAADRPVSPAAARRPAPMPPGSASPPPSGALPLAPAAPQPTAPQPFVPPRPRPAPVASVDPQRAEPVTRDLRSAVPPAAQNRRAAQDRPAAANRPAAPNRQADSRPMPGRHVPDAFELRPRDVEPGGWPHGPAAAPPIPRQAPEQQAPEQHAPEQHAPEQHALERQAPEQQAPEQQAGNQPADAAGSRHSAARHAGPDIAAAVAAGATPATTGPQPHQMPAAQMDRGHRTREARPTPPPAPPVQAQARVEPTPVHGYPSAHAEAPAAVQIPGPRAPQPVRQDNPDRPASPAAAPAPAVPGQATRHPRTAPAAPIPDQPSAARPAEAKPEAAPGAADPKPIARLQTSGPDGPRRYSDSGLGPTWFATKPTPPDTGGDHNESDNSGDNQNATEVGQGTRKIELPEDQQPEDESAGVVLDVDLTGLLNGMTAEQAIIEASGDTPSSPATGTATPALPAPEALLPQVAAIAASGREAGRGPDAQSWRERDDPARPPLMPGREPTEPKTLERPVKPLSAADLDAIRWRLDGGTLREVVDDQDGLRELGDRLDEPLSDETDNVARAGLLCVRAEVYRLLGELGMAAAASRLALAHAESAGDTQAIVIAQAELAHVLRLRGDSAEADRLFEEAASSEAHPAVRCVVHENAGRSCFDQGRHMEALDHFARAIRLGSPEDMDLVERIDVSLEAVYIHVLRDGWGPYPRLRREILGYVRPAATR